MERWRRRQIGYPLQQVSSLLREVGRQTQFALQDLVDGLFPVLAGERRLRRGAVIQDTCGSGFTGRR